MRGMEIMRLPTAQRLRALPLVPPAAHLPRPATAERVRCPCHRMLQRLHLPSGSHNGSRAWCPPCVRQRERPPRVVRQLSRVRQSCQCHCGYYSPQTQAKQIRALEMAQRAWIPCIQMSMRQCTLLETVCIYRGKIGIPRWSRALHTPHRGQTRCKRQRTQGWSLQWRF